MKGTLDFWCPVTRSFGTDWQSSGCGQAAGTRARGPFGRCEALGAGTQVTHASALEGSVRRATKTQRWFKGLRTAAAPAPLCLSPGPQAAPLSSEAARAEFKASHGEGFHDSSW